MRRELQKLVTEMVNKDIPLPLAKREFEAAFLMEMLSRNGGNYSFTAKQIGMHRNTLYRKVAQYSDPMCYPEMTRPDTSAGQVV